MRKIIFYLILLILVNSCFVSCKKTETSSKEETCIKGVLCFSIQGEEFISDTPAFNEYGYAMSGTYAELEKSTYSGATLVVLEITGYDLLKNTELKVEIYFPAIYDSTYRFSESYIRTVITRPDKQIQDMTNWCDGYNSELTEGYVRITAIDTASKFVSGFFNVPITCYSRETDGLWIYYENQILTGTFDSVVLQKTGGPW